MSVSNPVSTSIKQLIDRQVEEGRQIGVQVCAYKDGAPIVDEVAGTLGPDDSRPVQPDSLFHCWSTTKGVASTLVHILADRIRKTICQLHKQRIGTPRAAASQWRALVRNLVRQCKTPLSADSGTILLQAKRGDLRGKNHTMILSQLAGGDLVPYSTALL